MEDSLVFGQLYAMSNNQPSGTTVPLLPFFLEQDSRKVQCSEGRTVQEFSVFAFHKASEVVRSVSQLMKIFPCVPCFITIFSAERAESSHSSRPYVLVAEMFGI